MSRYSTIVLGLLLSSAAAIFASDNEPEYAFSFSSKTYQGSPEITDQKKFNCSDQIYTIVNAYNLAQESIQAIIIWRNPAGNIQEQTLINLHSEYGLAQGWAWIKLHKATGASMLSFIDDSIGMGDFIGDWQIELLIDNKRVTQDTFNVLC